MLCILAAAEELVVECSRSRHCRLRKDSLTRRMRGSLFVEAVELVEHRIWAAPEKVPRLAHCCRSEAVVSEEVVDPVVDGKNLHAFLLD